MSKIPKGKTKVAGLTVSQLRAIIGEEIEARPVTLMARIPAELPPFRPLPRVLTNPERIAEN